jgi:hypothetical protein
MRAWGRKSMTRKTSYPDLSDLLLQKAEMRQRRAKRSFEEKIEVIERLREQLKPFKEARETRKAEQQRYGLRPKAQE